jgi:DNA (cytosine-5)-methyltransferase 1
LLKDKQPRFFLAENVSGILANMHQKAVQNIIKLFEDAGYDVYIELLNASNYGVPQDRKRVFYVGLRKDLKCRFAFPTPCKRKFTLREAISDLKDNAVPALPYNKSNGDNCTISDLARILVPFYYFVF